MWSFHQAPLNLRGRDAPAPHGPGGQRVRTGRRGAVMSGPDRRGHPSSPCGVSGYGLAHGPDAPRADGGGVDGESPGPCAAHGSGALARRGRVRSS